MSKENEDSIYLSLFYLCARHCYFY